MPETALTLKAHFKAVVPSEYGIIVEDDGHGTAKAQVSSVDVTSAAPGATVTLVATPNDGYKLKEWQVERGGITVNKMRCTFEMPSNEVKIKAIFQRVYTIEVVAQGHGTASASDQKSITGREITLTAAPEDGYQLDHWEVERGGVTVGANNKFYVGTADVKIKAVFAKRVETKTVAGILATVSGGFATTKETGWTNGTTGKAFTTNMLISMLNFAVEGESDTAIVLLGSTAAKSGDNYVFEDTQNHYTVTFVMEDGVLGSIEFVATEGARDFIIAAEGTYTAPNPPTLLGASRAEREEEPAEVMVSEETAAEGTGEDAEAVKEYEIPVEMPGTEISEAVIPAIAAEMKQEEGFYGSTAPLYAVHKEKSNEEKCSDQD